MIVSGRHSRHTSVLLDELLARLDAEGLKSQAASARALLDATPSLSGGGANPLPVLRQLDAALTNADRVDGARHVSEALRAIGPLLRWTQTHSYLRDPPNPDFLAGYAHATILGPPDGATTAPASGRDDEAALGVVLLGRGIVYPAHEHPADEVYLPLGPARWLESTTAGYTTRPAGVLIHHRPRQPHGTIVGPSPVLLLYLWTGDVHSPSRWSH